MWINPNHPDRERLLARQQGEGQAAATAMPPEPSGEQLVAIPRRNRQGPATELRVSVDSYEGHPYVSVRLWQEGSGGWWPVKGKGVTVRMSELEAVADALGQAIASRGELDRQREPVREGRGSSSPDRQQTAGWSRDRDPRPPRPEGPPSDDYGY